MTDCYCLWCGRSLRMESSLRNMFQIDDVLCDSCRSLIRYRPKRIRLSEVSVDSLYVYEGFIREMLIQYKELYDEALFPLFLYPHVEDIRKRYRGYTIVPVPSSRENNEKRGFRAVEKMFGILNMPMVEMLVKTDDHDQKNTDFSRRHEIISHLEIKPVNVRNRKVLLVDDILTTGETVKAAATLLMRKGYRIKVLTLCYNRRFASKQFCLQTKTKNI